MIHRAELYRAAIIREIRKFNITPNKTRLFLVKNRGKTRYWLGN